MLKFNQIESMLKAGGFSHTSADIYKFFKKKQSEGNRNYANKLSAINFDSTTRSILIIIVVFDPKL